MTQDPQDAPAQAQAAAQANAALIVTVLSVTILDIIYTNVRRCADRIIRDACIGNPQRKALVDNMRVGEAIGIWSESMRHFILVGPTVAPDGRLSRASYRIELLDRSIFTPEVLERHMRSAGWHVKNMGLFWQLYLEVIEAHNGRPKYNGS